MANDVRNYILGCMKCAQHGNAQRTQTQSPTVIDEPNVLWGMDYIGPLPKTAVTTDEALKCMWPQLHKSKSQVTAQEPIQLASQPLNDYGFVNFTHILLVVDYFDRFVWAFPTITDSQDETIRCLTWLINQEGAPVATYQDTGGHFGKRTTKFLKGQGTESISSPVAAKKATGMVEKANDILQITLKLITRDPHCWPWRIQEAVFEGNRRQISYLGYSPFEIRRGYQPISALEQEYRLPKQSVTLDTLKSDIDAFLEISEDDHVREVDLFVQNREVVRDLVIAKTSWRKQVQKERHDRGVREQTFKPGDYVMLYDGKSAKKKLHPAYRGPFVVAGHGGCHGKSYLLRQVNGKPIPRTYYGDHLKLFKLREGHLVTGREGRVPFYQNLRAGTANHKLPAAVGTGDTEWSADD
ncbi:hypothetical protein K3495_g13592 [Podosphaera aphanis]|nr:hypothetical protein K3495_g13592 [Podosphaera aphanis]